MSKTQPTIVQRLQALDDELVHLRTETARCEDAIATADRHAGKVDILRERLRDERAKGFLQRLAVDVKGIERDLAAAEKAHAVAQMQAEVAADAIALAEHRIATIESERRTVEAEREATARGTITAQYKTAFTRYGEAVAALAEPVAVLTAAELAWRQLFGDDLHSRFPGRTGIVQELQACAGLRVPWEFSALRHPEVAGQFNASTYSGAADAFCPEWLNDAGLADKALAELAAELLAIGYALNMPTRSKEAPPRLVRVTLRACTVQGLPTPGTGRPNPGNPRQAIDMELCSVTGPGTVIEVESEEAARLVALGFADMGEVQPSELPHPIEMGQPRLVQIQEFHQHTPADPNEPKNAKFIHSRAFADDMR